MTKKARLFSIILTILILVTLIVFIICSGNPKDIEADARYECDVQSLNLNTAIKISKNDDSLYTIKGKVVKLIEDPLTMYDSNNQKIAYADDSFHVVNQDSHVVSASSGGRYEVVGDFNFFGDSYRVYQDGKLIATAEFNMWNTYGTLCNTEGDLIADYTSRLGFNDYIVQIKSNNEISDQMILIIISSLIFSSFLLFIL